MKWPIIFLLAATIFGFATCKKQSPTFNENQIPVNKCQSFTVDGEIIDCCLDSVIQDSRCPLNAVCIWEGIGVVRLIAKSQNTDHIIILATSKFGPYKKDTTFAGFKIELINLSFQKELGKPFNYQDYVAEVKITK